MKKIFLALLLLPLMAAAFIACSSDDDITPAEPEQPAKDKPVTFIATVEKKTRVTYTDGTNSEGKATLFSSWDDNDNGKTVMFYDSNTSKKYVFNITSINSTDGTATLTYSGNLDDGSKEKFPIETFAGIATYEVGSTAETPTQAANSSTAHLHYGTKLETSTLSNLTEGTQITFSHKETCFFRVKLNAPVDIAGDEELLVKANGVEIGKVKLDFSVAKDALLTAYVRCTSQADATELSYKIVQGNMVYTYTSKYTSAHNINAGEYYYTDLTTKTPSGRDKDIDDAFGNAPNDVSPVDIKVYLDEDFNITENEDEYAYKVFISDRYLGATNAAKSWTEKSTTDENEPDKKVMDDGGRDCLYFYWGDVVGHRVDQETYQLIGEDPQYMGGNTSQLYGNNPVGVLRKSYTTVANLESALVAAGYMEKTTAGKESYQDYRLTDAHDAAKVQWGGGWQMIDFRIGKAVHKWSETYYSRDHAYFKKKSECKHFDADCDCSNQFTVGRLYGFDIAEGNVNTKPGDRKVTLPAVGIVGYISNPGHDIVYQTWTRHYTNNSVSGLFWSRDYMKASNPTLRGKAYAYGLLQDTGNNEVSQWKLPPYNSSDMTNHSAMFYIDTGLPILPCLVVKYKKTSTGQ